MIKTRKRMLNFMTINIEQFDKDLCSKLFFFSFYLKTWDGGSIFIQLMSSIGKIINFVLMQMLNEIQQGVSIHNYYIKCISYLIMR